MPPLDPKLPRPPPGIPDWRKPQIPPGRPSILNRLGMTGLSILPILATIGACWTGFALPYQPLLYGGAILGAIIIVLLVLAQTTPDWRKAAMIALGAISGLVLTLVACTVVIIALIYAICAGK